MEPRWSLVPVLGLGELTLATAGGLVWPVLSVGSASVVVSTPKAWPAAVRKWRCSVDVGLELLSLSNARPPTASDAGTTWCACCPRSRVFA